MKISAFKEWLGGVLDLSRPQRDMPQECLEPAAYCDAVISCVESREPSFCPRCQGGRLYRCGRKAGLQRFLRRTGGGHCSSGGEPLGRHPRPGRGLPHPGRERLRQSAQGMDEALLWDRNQYLKIYLGWRRWGEEVTPQVVIHAAMGWGKPFQLLMQA